MLILASQSQIRRQILAQSGVAFKAMIAPCDEELEKQELGGLQPLQMAEALALAKARSTSSLHPSATVIGADQTLECDGQLLNKPKDINDARQQLSKLRAKNHQVHSAIAVTKADAILYQTVSTATLKMRNFSDGFLENYLKQSADKVLDGVGCYQIESLGIQLFDQIEGDHFAILGLPLLPLLAFLRKIGEVQS
jgi:septum formation protein